MKRLNLRIIGIEGEVQLKNRENTLNKIKEENFPNLQKDMPMKIQEAYRTASLHYLPQLLAVGNGNRDPLSAVTLAF